MKRIASIFLLVAAASLSRFALAGLEFVRELSEADKGVALTTGLYTVPEHLVLTGEVAKSAFSIADGATVALYIEPGKTLEVTGGDATESSGAGAGIGVPTGAKLIVVGEGKLMATGGAATPGGVGGACGKWVVDESAATTSGTTGAGGAGGTGGNGAGAGIGGGGGLGGAGGAGAAGADIISISYTSGTDGEGGQSGLDADCKDVGEMIFSGPIAVSAVSGAAAVGGTNGWAHIDGELWSSAYGGSSSYRVSAGGPGGGGGGGVAAYAGIGYGGPGGGGGGGGGSGGCGLIISYGGCGAGGKPNGRAASTLTAGNFEGGDGGLGGTVPDHSSSPCPVYLTVSATNTVSGAGTTNIVASPAELQYTITFEDGKGMLSSVPAPLTVTLAEPYGACAAVTLKPEYADWFFLGWYDGVGGTGTRYFDVSGTPQIAAYRHVGDVKLYARFGLIDAIEPGVVIDGVEVPMGSTNSVDGGWTSTNGNITFTGRDTAYHLSGTNLFGNATLNVTTNASFVFDSLRIPNVLIKGKTGIFNVASGCVVTVTLRGESSLVTLADKTAGIFCPSGARLTLVSEDSGISCDDSTPGQVAISVSNTCERFNLVARGGAGAAGIGGVDGQDRGRSGEIIFKNVSVAASGGTGAQTDVGHATLTDGATVSDCGQILISTDSSVRPVTDSSTSRTNPITVEPAPYDTYDRRVFPFRCLTTAMSYGFWVSYGSTSAVYTGSDTNQTGYMSVTITPKYPATLEEYNGTAEPE